MALELNNRQPRGFKADRGMTYQTIEQECAFLRTFLVPGLPVDEPLPGLSLFESLNGHTVGAAGREIPLEFGVAELAPGVEGRSRFDRETDRLVVELNPEVYTALCRNEPRARNTTGHEIFHTMCHTEMLVRISEIPHSVMALQRASGPTHRHFEDTEWQANAGSAALLMPAAGLALLEQRNGSLSTGMIEKRFQVSGQAASYRLRTFQERRRDLV